MPVNELRNNLNITNERENNYERVCRVQKHMLETPADSLNDSQIEWVEFAREDLILVA